MGELGSGMSILKWDGIGNGMRFGSGMSELGSGMSELGSGKWMTELGSELGSDG